jgi:hypothetical protein
MATLLDTPDKIAKHRGTSTEGFFEDRANQHQFVIGDAVFRANWDRVEEGRVIRIQRIKLDSQGNSRGAYPDGDFIETTAKFGGDYESQTYCWKFFPRVETAQSRLAELAASHAEEKRREAARWDALVEKAKAGEAPVRPHAGPPIPKVA